VLAVIPVQDLLQLGSEARYNVPGTSTNNWCWRMAEGALTSQLGAHYRQLNETFGRSP